MTTRESSADFPLRTSVTLLTSRQEHLKAHITGNFLDRPTDGLKTEASFLGILSLFAVTHRAVVYLVLGEISLDNMKVISAMLLVAIFLSQEWKSALSDSIIHIGELLRFFLFQFAATIRLSVRLSGNRLEVSALMCAALLKSQRCWCFI